MHICGTRGAELTEQHPDPVVVSSLCRFTIAVPFCCYEVEDIFLRTKIDNFIHFDKPETEIEQNL